MPTYNNRGVAYGVSGQYDKAIADCTDAIRLDPKDAGAYGLRGLVHSVKGEWIRRLPTTLRSFGSIRRRRCVSQPGDRLFRERRDGQGRRRLRPGQKLGFRGSSFAHAHPLYPRWQSTPGGVKPPTSKTTATTVLNPALPDDNFEAAVTIAQVEFDRHHPDVVVGSSRGGAVAMNINIGSTPLCCSARLGNDGERLGRSSPARSFSLQGRRRGAAGGFPRARRNAASCPRSR